MIPLLLLLLAVGLFVATVVVGLQASGNRRRAWADRTTARVAWSAVVAAAVAGVALALVPLSSTTVSVSEGTTTLGTTASTTITTHRSLVESEGAGVVMVLLVPVAVALAGAAGRRGLARARRIVAGSVLLVLCVLGLMSIGVFFLPAAVLLLVAGAKTGGTTGGRTARKPRRPHTSGPRPAVPG